MTYQHTFQVRAPLRRVAEFHRRAASMAAITPPPVIVRLHRAPSTLSEGDEMDFTLWVGPFPIRWLARIEAASSNGFSDRQLRGPFSMWIHRHRFSAVDEQVTEVVDEISLQPQSHPFWWLVGIGMRVSLPFLFAYRAWKTKKLLQ